MCVIRANIQTVEDMYRLIWTAISNRQPISAIYKELPRLFCPHRLGRNRLGEPRVLCYQYGGESESGLGPIGSPDNWRLRRFRETAPRGIGERFLEDCAESLASGQLYR
jgi:hypothetical protein